MIYATYSNDSRWLLCVGERDAIQCWDLMTPDGPQVHQLQARQTGTYQPLRAMFSPDSKWLAVASRPDTRVRLWALPTQQWTEPRWSLDVHVEPVTDLLFSPDSRSLATLSADRTAVWDLSAENPAVSPRELAAEPPPTELGEFSHDSQRLTTIAQEDRVQLWRIPGDQQNPVVREGGDLPAVAAFFSADDRWLLTGTAAGYLELRDLRSATLESRPIELDGFVMEKSEDGRWLYVLANEKTQTQQRVQGWLLDLNSEHPEQDLVTLTGNGRIALLTANSNDYSWLAMTLAWDYEEDETQMWVFRRNRLDLQPVARSAFRKLLPRIMGAVAMNSDGRWLAAGVGDDELLVWDLQRRDWDTSSVKLDMSGAFCGDLLMDGAGRRLVAATDTGTVLTWHLDSSGNASRLPPLGEPGESHSLKALSPNGQWLITVCNGNTAYAWNLEDPRPTQSRVSLASDSRLFFEARFSPDNRWLTTEIFSNPIQLRRVSSEGELGDSTVLEGADKFVSGIAFSPDGLWLAMINSLGALHVYDLAAAHPAANPKWTSPPMQTVRCLRFDPHGRWLATGSEDATVRLWDMDSDDPTANPRLLRGHDRPVWGLAFDPQGTHLATGDSDGKVLLWDLRDKSNRWSPIVLPGSSHGISAPLYFSPDGAYLGAGEHSQLLVWNMDLAALMALAKRLAGRKLTEREAEIYVNQPSHE